MAVGKQIRKNILAIKVIAMLSIFSDIPVKAADVPAGVKLADKQELVRGNGSEVQSLDPHKVQGNIESNVINDLLEGLTQYDSRGETVPGVAESWENKDLKVWTFHIRKDAKWSNGQPVTANDFVYSWQRIVDPTTASPYASYLQYAHVANVDDIITGKKDKSALGVKALDDKTFQVTLTEPVPYFIEMTSFYPMKPVNKEVIEKFADKWTQPEHYVSNGPYKLKNWIVNERIVLQRNPEYWDDAKTVINQVTFLPITSLVAEVNRYRAGEIDMTYTLPDELFQKLKKELPNEIKVNPFLSTYYYTINNQKPPFTDKRVREALKLALDRDIIVYKVLNQGQQPAYSLTPPYTNGAKLTPPEWFGWPQEKRNQEAKKLLAEAGYGPDKPLTFTLLYNTSENHKKLAIAAVSIWKKNLGGQINVKLENQEWKTYVDTRHQGNFEVVRSGWVADYNDPSAFLNIMLSDSSNNYAFYKSAVFDKIMASALQAGSKDARSAVYQQAEQQLDKDSAIIPIYYYVNKHLVKPYVGGYTADLFDNIYDKDLYIIQH